MPYSLKQCTLDDLGELATITTETFITAFEDQNNPDEFEIYINKAFNHKQLTKELNNPDTAFYFVHDNSKIVGYMKLNIGAAQTDIKSEEALEIERIYVVSEYQGRKVGGWMIEEIIKIAVAKGKTHLWLGVWEHNVSAIRFYDRHHFTKFGEHPYYVGEDRQMDWLMRLDLTTLESTK